MRTRILSAVGLLVVVMSVAALATSTENQGLQIVPAPGPVKIDGKFDDWDLSAGMFSCINVEDMRETRSSWFHAMYDQENLYMLGRIKDSTPLNNPGQIGADFGWRGDCMLVRIVTNYNTPQERVCHVLSWQGRTGTGQIGDVVEIDYGRNFDAEKVKDAKLDGAKQVLVKDPDGEGYVQEIAVPWKFLTKDGQPLKAGDTMRVQALGDNFMPGVAIDRPFAFRAYPQFGLATLAAKGKLDGGKVRLADKREFPIQLANGLPTVQWGELKRVLPPEPFELGIKEIGFTMPEDGFVSLIIKSADGMVVRHLLNCQAMTKGEQKVKWDGLGDPMWQVPGQSLAAGSYTWEAIWHKGIGLRLRGWASNGGTTPWDNGPGTNWGGDHGMPVDCASEGDMVYLGWDGSEAGKAMVACDLDGNVQWRSKRGGFGSARLVAVDGDRVYIDNWDPLGIYCVDQKTQLFQFWGATANGTGKAELASQALWDDPAGKPERPEGMAARNGKLYLTYSSFSFRKEDITDWRKFLTMVQKDETLGAKIRQRLHERVRPQIEKWLASEQPEDVGLKSLGQNIPDARVDVVSALNKLLPEAGLAADITAKGADLPEANRRLLEKAFAPCIAARVSNLVAVVEAGSGKMLKSIPLASPGRLAVVSDTLVYVVSRGTEVVAVDPAAGTTRTVVTGLTNATGIAVDSGGRIYVGVGDPDQQVKVFGADGQALRTIGRQGGRPALGKFDRDGMFSIAGMTIDRQNKLWVAEADRHPKRISVWDAATGKFMKEFFGATHYGASGGAIHPRDPNVMVGAGCEWKIDPTTGRETCIGTFDRQEHNFARFCRGSNGRDYLAVSGDALIKVFERLAPGDYRLRASVQSDRTKAVTTFWSDKNGDGQAQDDEVASLPGAMTLGGYYYWSHNMNVDLTIAAGAGKQGLFIRVAGFTDCGAPQWNLSDMGKLPPVQGALATLDNRLVLACDHDPALLRCLDTASGKLLWTYPNQFAGVHGSHKAPGSKVGLLRGVFGVIGSAHMPEPLGEIWALNSNVGEWHVFTGEGYYLTRLFSTSRGRWPEKAVPGAVMDNVPPGAGGEDFGGSLVQGDDGNVYVQAGKVAFWNIQVVGLETVKKLGSGSLSLNETEVRTALTSREQRLQQAVGPQSCTIKQFTPAFTGNVAADFKASREQMLDFKKQDDAAVLATAAWDDQNLYLAWDVRDDSPWTNAADAPAYLYAHGDTVDFQIGADAKADANRGEAVQGDLRLSIGNFKGKPTAVLYRKVAQDAHPMTFSSGVIKQYRMDSVTTLDQVETKVVVRDSGGRKGYVVEAKMPLSALGIAPTAGLQLRGDFGVTHGDAVGEDTRLRTYWSNQATGIVDDEVFELKMEPKNWGTLSFEK